MPLNNFGCVTRNLYRSAQPDQQGILDLSRIGIATIIKVNNGGAPEESAWCSNSSIKLVQLPMNTYGNTIESITAVIDRINSEMTVPTLVHCTHGRDRTGLVIAAWRLKYQKATLDVVQQERAMYGVVGIYKLLDAEMDILLKNFAASLAQ